MSRRRLSMAKKLITDVKSGEYGSALGLEINGLTIPVFSWNKDQLKNVN
jgi:hypothetical protein